MVAIIGNRSNTYRPKEFGLSESWQSRPQRQAHDHHTTQADSIRMGPSWGFNLSFTKVSYQIHLQYKAQEQTTWLSISYPMPHGLWSSLSDSKILYMQSAESHIQSPWSNYAYFSCFYKKIYSLCRIFKGHMTYNHDHGKPRTPTLGNTA